MRKFLRIISIFLGIILFTLMSPIINITPAFWQWSVSTATFLGVLFLIVAPLSDWLING